MPEALIYFTPMPSSSRDRSYSSPPAQHNIAAQYGWSPDFVQTGSANSVTGNWIPQTVDSSGFLKVVIVSGGSTTNVDVSGLSLSVGAVNLTGTNVVTTTGNQPVNIVNPVVAVSGIVQTPDTGVRAVAVTNTVTINSGSYTPGFAIITGSQTQIPIGAKSASVAIISGSAYINGSGAFPAGLTLGFGGYDGRFPLASAINVGATGSIASPSQVIILWEV